MKSTNVLHVDKNLTFNVFFSDITSEFKVSILASNLPLSCANDEPRNNNTVIIEDWIHRTHMPMPPVYIHLKDKAWSSIQYISAGQGIRLHLCIAVKTT